MADPTPIAAPTTCPNCPCGWSEWEVYDQTKGPTATSGKRTDQWGYLYPTDPAAPGARDSEASSPSQSQSISQIKEV